MPPVKKMKRKSKPPPRLKEFLCEDAKDKEKEPRRSSRTPKISEKLKIYMDDKGGLMKDQDLEQASNQVKKDTLTSAYHLLGAEYKEPKVVLRALPKSFLQKGIRKYPVSKREPRVTLKRLSNYSAGNKKGSRVYISKLHKQRAGSAKAASGPSSDISQAAVEKIKVKVNVENAPSRSTKELPLKRKGKRKRTSEPEADPREKHIRATPRASNPKFRDGSIKEVKRDLRFDPDVMKKLFSFGAKVEEVLALNNEAINQLTKDSKKAQSITQLINDKLEDADSGDFEKILNWLEGEECQRREHREKVLESLRVSHKTNMALYSHMLTVLQSVTGSV